VVYHPFRNP
jgi:hypothetical protein